MIHVTQIQLLRYSCYYLKWMQCCVMYVTYAQYEGVEIQPTITQVGGDNQHYPSNYQRLNNHKQNFKIQNLPLFNQVFFIKLKAPTPLHQNGCTGRKRLLGWPPPHPNPLPCLEWYSTNNFLALKESNWVDLRTKKST